MDNKELLKQNKFTIEDKKQIKSILNKKIDKFLDPYIKDSKKALETDEFYKRHWTIFSKKRMNEIVKIYDNVIKTIHKEIDKLEKDRTKIFQKNIRNIVKKYQPKNKNEIIIFITTFLEQPIKNEYDIFILINSKIFTENEKKALFTIYMEYQLEISKKYLELVDYLTDNKEIWYYKQLKDLLLWLNNTSLIYSYEYKNILNNKKIKRENYKTLYKDEIKEYYLYKNNSEKYLKLRNTEFKKFFKDYTYKRNNFFQYKWITLESFDEKYKYNDEFINKKDIDYLVKNKDISIITNKEQIILRINIRNDIKYIKEWIRIYLEDNWFKNKINNAFLLDHEYLKNDEIHNKILIKIKE